jgi:hypothetical protein
MSLSGKRIDEVDMQQIISTLYKGLITIAFQHQTHGSLAIEIVAYFLKPRTVKPTGTAVARKRL